MTLIERINGFINAVASDIKSLYANKVNKTDVIAVAQGGTGATDAVQARANLDVYSKAETVALIPTTGNSGSSNSDISVLLPRKIGASQRWYQSGLRHGADYPYHYAASSLITESGAQYFVPFTALEDATIAALEIQCTTAQSNGNVSLGIYASDGNNGIANPLFTSNPINCSTTGAKNAPCNVQITKGKVYWLSALPIGAPSFHRNTTDSLFPIKGSKSASSMAIIGHYTTGNTGMAQSAPANKVDVSAAPRVLFMVA